MEEFQGQERNIIIISTVRSSLSYVKMDTDFNIGFLSNEKVCLILSLLYYLKYSRVHLFMQNNQNLNSVLYLYFFRGLTWR